MNQWINWIKKLQAISQTGIAYSKDPYDLERSEEIKEISHQMLSEISGAPIEKVKNLFISDKGYPTPKVDLRAGVIRDNKILLVRERQDNCWTLPGGWADVCETPSQGIVREVFEESGFVVSAPRLVAVVDRDVHPYKPKYPHHIYKLFFICNLDSGEPTVNLEISEIGFFEIDKLPSLSESRVLEKDIERMFQYFNNPSCEIHLD